MIRKAMLFSRDNAPDIDCRLCRHTCRIAPGERGLCSVRINRDGTLYSEVYGELIAAHVDPIEKKPLYHFQPGSLSFSIAAQGCNFQCSFCQNWTISQAPRRDGRREGTSSRPDDVVQAALRHRCRSISYTYTEPTIFYEFAYDTARIARERGLANVFVTNGYMTREALRTSQPWLDACNVDLKSFRDDFYREICRARLNPVLDSIRFMKELGIWVEITTLVVPGLNDSENELKDIAAFIAGLDPAIPWHISRFHPDFEYGEGGPTPMDTLRTAARIGRESGLHYVYIGNVPGEGADTMCPSCGRTVIKRSGFSTDEVLLKGSSCPFCSRTVAGVFDHE